jgi:two-component system chemotaxis response regulator CheY
MKRQTQPGCLFAFSPPLSLTPTLQRDQQGEIFLGKTVKVLPRADERELWGNYCFQVLLRGNTKAGKGMGKALVVDDSRAVRMILSKILRDLGYETHEAANGVEALELMESEGASMALVLADWNMPEMNGLDLLKRLRQNPAFVSIPVVMVTTETGLDQMVTALEAGANEYVMKPFTKDILVEKLQMAGVHP